MIVRWGLGELAAVLEELSIAGPFLRNFGVPRSEFDLVSAAAAERGPAKANPRHATQEAIATLLRSVW